MKATVVELKIIKRPERFGGGERQACVVSVTDGDVSYRLNVCVAGGVDVETWLAAVDLEQLWDVAVRKGMLESKEDQERAKIVAKVKDGTSSREDERWLLLDLLEGRK